MMSWDVFLQRVIDCRKRERDGSSNDVVAKSENIQLAGQQGDGGRSVHGGAARNAARVNMIIAADKQHAVVPI